jgi:protoheme IX farnesyltransferase
MERTKDRPLPSGKLKPSTVLKNGIFLVIFGMLIAILTLNLLTVFIIFLGFFFDVVIYTVLLKRRTKLSIFFGGIAGGLPALAGRTAIIGIIDVTGLLFLFFILAWIPVHILTLALIPRNFKGYKEAKIPMWPIVSTEKKTMRIIAIGAFFTSIILYENARHLQANGIIRIIIGICCLFLLILVMRNLMKPSNKLTFLIFKVASLFMIIGFLLLYLGVVFI